MADKTTQELERIYMIPLREVKSSPRNHQADRAIRHIKKYLQKHMKTEDIWIDASVNEFIWKRGMYTTPSKIRVRARRFDDGVVEVSLPDVEVKASIRTTIQERREKASEKKDEKKKAAKDEEKADEKAEEKPKAKAAPEGRKATPWSERKVIDIEGVGPKYEADLAKAGVKLMDQLIEQDAAELAKKTGISQTLVETWQGMADLDRLDSVNNQYAELLVRSEVNRVEQLATWSPAALVKKVNAYLATVDRAPTTQAVTDAIAGEWIAEAKKAGRTKKTEPRPAAKGEKKA